MSVKIYAVGSFRIYRTETLQFNHRLQGPPHVGYMASRRGKWVVGAYRTALGATLALFTRRSC